MTEVAAVPAELARILAIRTWACRAEYLRAVSRLAREGPHAAEALKMQVRPSRTMGEGVMVLPIYGLITQRGGWFGCGTQEIWQALAAALADPAVSAIVLEHDSPGGEVYGVEELGARIRAARGAKPIISHVNSLSASASYWIAAQADEVIITPSGEAGSVGVYTVHEDWSGALDMAGIKIEFITAGDGKVDGNPYEPLSDEARADMQAQVDRYYSMFLSAVSKARKVGASKISKDWKAKVYGAKDCITLGVADSIGTLEDAIARAAQLGRKRKSASATAPIEGAPAAVASAMAMAEDEAITTAHPDQAPAATEPAPASDPEPASAPDPGPDVDAAVEERIRGRR